jgi:prepilin-type N-terminal cleavage/methylation domain-containing protein/prepilin-type processing-associated H-X9-DG protein
MSSRAPPHHRRPRQGFTLIELLAVIAIMAILVGLILSAVQKVRDAAARAQCQNNVRQIALGLHQFHDSRGKLPVGHHPFRDPDNMRWTGWTISLLPYLEQQALAAQIAESFRQSPNAFVNPPHGGIRKVIPLFICPTDGRIVTAVESEVSHRLVAFTSYLGVSGVNSQAKNGVLFQGGAVNLTDVTDGTSSTLMMGERPPSTDLHFGWWYAGVGQRFGGGDMILGVREQNLLPINSKALCGPGNYPYVPGRFDDQCAMFHFWSPHPGGANFAFCDGSVRFVAYSANPIMPALATRAGGEVVGDF